MWYMCYMWYMLAESCYRNRHNRPTERPSTQSQAPQLRPLRPRQLSWMDPRSAKNGRQPREIAATMGTCQFTLHCYGTSMNVMDNPWASPTFLIRFFSQYFSFSGMFSCFPIVCISMVFCQWSTCSLESSVCTIKIVPSTWGFWLLTFRTTTQNSYLWVDNHIQCISK